MQATGKAEEQVDKAGKQVDKASNNGTSDSVVGAAAVAQPVCLRECGARSCTSLTMPACTLPLCLKSKQVVGAEVMCCFLILQGDAAQEAQKKVRKQLAFHIICVI